VSSTPLQSSADPVVAGALGSPEKSASRVSGFRLRLFTANMLVVALITLLGLYFAQGRLAQNAAEELQRDFQSQLAARHNAQQLRLGALLERGRALVRKSRIHAALEDDALELLYPNAEDELRDVMSSGRSDDPVSSTLHASFYRFLDRHGAVLSPADAKGVGPLAPEESARLALPALTSGQQIGYVQRLDARGRPIVSEVITVPIVSSETGEVIAALALGFTPFKFSAGTGLRSGIWTAGKIDNPELAAVADQLLVRDSAARDFDKPETVELAGSPYLAFTKLLNPGSAYPEAYEVCVYPLSETGARQRELRWQILLAGGGLLLLGLAGSHLVAGRLSRPVEDLAVVSAEDRTLRRRAEAALELTSADLQRSARFSADASHQLKTPVTVLRAGLEELLSHENLRPEECQEVSALIHQTYRLSSLIEDLLLLSRLDAGRLKLELAPLNLAALIEASLDDLSAVPDDMGLRLETEFAAELMIEGEKRYTAIILQNLLENARKYNRKDGRIQIRARTVESEVWLTVANSGQPIPREAQARIFERFHRGAMGENVPGYGLGLNLARELARLHGGELTLLRSDEAETEFEVRFRAASRGEVEEA
jgi:signal transduction histidine kinase